MYLEHIMLVRLFMNVKNAGKSILLMCLLFFVPNINSVGFFYNYGLMAVKYCKKESIPY